MYLKMLINLIVKIIKLNSKGKNYSDKIINEIIDIVKDSYKGIDPDIFPMLFTNLTSKFIQGTGLGLHLQEHC